MIISSLSTVHKTRMLRVGSYHLFVFFSLNQLSDLWKVKVFSSNCLNHSQPLITLQIFSTEEKYIHWCVLHMRIKYIMGWFSLVYLKKTIAFLLYLAELLYCRFHYTFRILSFLLVSYCLLHQRRIHRPNLCFTNVYGFCQLWTINSLVQDFLITLS